jgi:hypothetical protein
MAYRAEPQFPRLPRGLPPNQPFLPSQQPITQAEQQVIKQEKMSAMISNAAYMLA